MLRLAQAIHALRRAADRLSLSRTCSRFSQVTAIGLWAIAARDPDVPAVIAPDGAVVSYAELAREADRYGRGFQALGLVPGDTIATLLPNGVTALAAYFAAIETGLYIVPINWHQVAAEIGYILTDSGAGVFVADERFAGAAREAADLAGIKHRFAAGAVPGFEPASRLGDDGTDARPSPRTHGAPMLYTSGTSGRPKGVRRPLTGMDPDDTAVMAAWFFSLFDIAPFGGHVHLCGSPLYHTAVLNFATISIQLGHPVVLMDRWDPEESLRLIAAHQWLRKPGSVGLPWKGSEIKVLDRAGHEVAAGERGLVYMKMGTSSFSYHRDEEKTRAARAGGMFTVGDIGYLDADGYLFLCDRGSDVIISGGVNIYPAEIEAELSCHPAVADVAVFGIPHDDWGEEVKAVVEPVPGTETGPGLTAELLAFLSGRVARFKLPRTIDYVAELPRDPNGKLYKRRLRDPYWAGRDQSI